MIFYDRLLDDDQVGPYFDNVDMPGLIDHQTKFIASIMGGPASFSDEHLQRVHAPHHISKADFNRMVEILASALLDGGIARDDVNQVIAEIQRRAPVIVDATE